MFYNASMSKVSKNNNITVLKIHQPKPSHPVMDEVKNRFSPRYFSPKKVKDKDVKSILEAARWAPSGHNTQPWQFYYAHQKTKAYQELLSTMNEYNQSWAYSAPLLILANVIPEDEKQKYPFAFYDLGSAVFSLVIQAQNLGYFTRQIGLFDHNEVKRLFRLKRYCEPRIIIAVGKIGDYNQASSEILEYELDPRPRKDDVFLELKLK